MVTLKIPNRGLTIIDECEFYKFVLQSEMPKADAFADWVCGEVLPLLRKNNYYIDEQNVDNKQIEELKERIDKLEKYRAEMENMQMNWKKRIKQWKMTIIQIITTQ